MAEPLKNSFGPRVPRRIADLIKAVYPAFDSDQFLEMALDGYADLELIPRAKHIAKVLTPTLPEDPEKAISILLESVAPGNGPGRLPGMESFLYFPHVQFVADNGLTCVDQSLSALRTLTMLFTSEFGIRPFIEAHPEKTMARLGEWALDSDEHVRRLVSEGTRPRLPWAPRLKRFQKDPSPILPLLEALKDDPSEYVRRSVANNLNDIAKDHPKVVLAVARTWWKDGSVERRKLIKHALRTLIKAGNSEALAIVGYAPNSDVIVTDFTCSPTNVPIGGRVQIRVELTNTTAQKEHVLVDLRVHFVKSNGTSSVKVFKGRELQIEPGHVTPFTKTISITQQTTRTHYPGEHVVELLVNGSIKSETRFICYARTEPLH